MRRFVSIAMMTLATFMLLVHSVVPHLHCDEVCLCCQCHEQALFDSTNINGDQCLCGSVSDGCDCLTSSHTHHAEHRDGCHLTLLGRSTDSDGKSLLNTILAGAVVMLLPAFDSLNAIVPNSWLVTSRLDRPFVEQSYQQTFFCCTGFRAPPFCRF